jgi:hypothetical protein
LPNVARTLPRSGPTGGVSLAAFHRCWHLEDARTSHRYTQWISNHSSGFAARSSVRQNRKPIAGLCLLHVSIYHRLADLSSGTTCQDGWMTADPLPIAVRCPRPRLGANNDETPLTTLPRLDHSALSARENVLGLAVKKLLSLLTFFAAAKKVSPAPDRGRANKPLRKQVP